MIFTSTRVLVMLTDSTNYMHSFYFRHILVRAKCDYTHTEKSLSYVEKLNLWWKAPKADNIQITINS